MTSCAEYSADCPSEMRLIQAVVAADWSAQTMPCLDETSLSRLNWHVVLNHSWRYKIRPMMAATLRRTAWSYVPPAIRQEFEAAELRCNQRNLWQVHLLSSLAAAAELHSLRYIVLKGVTLSMQLYGSPTLRESFDLDILVPSNCHAIFRNILTEHRVLPIQPAISPRQSELLMQFHDEERFRHEPSGTIVELHNRLDRNPHLIKTDFDMLWQARRYMPLGPQNIHVLGPHDLPHYLGIHATRHGWERWKWLADLIALFRHASDEELASIRVHAQHDGNADIFDSWLLMIDHLGSSILPALSVKRAAENLRAQRLADRSLRHGMRTITPDMLSHPRNLVREFCYRTQLKPDLRYRAYELAVLFHNDPDWRDLRLPDHLIWLYYVIRPFGYLRRRWKTLLGYLKRKEMAP